MYCIANTYEIHKKYICNINVLQMKGVLKMADIKATSFRVSEDDIAKFKEFADKEGYNQAEAFKSIMQTVEMAKAKNMIKDRAKEIEVFQDTINNLMSMFLNSLNVNQTSEERIREELSQELQTKDNTISNLQKQLTENENDIKRVKELSANRYEEIQKLSAAGVKQENVNRELQKTIDKLNSNNDLLQEQLKEYKQYKDDYKKLNNQLDQLKAEHEELKKNNNKLNNDNELLNNKISANSDMIEFYKNEIVSKDKDIDNYKSDIKESDIKYNSQIKELEAKYNTKIEEVKEEHEKALNDQLRNNIDNLNAKHEIELSKKDLEIQKLKNEIEQLKSKPKATRKTEK